MPREAYSVDTLADKELGTISDKAIGAIIERVGERHRTVAVESFNDLASFVPAVKKQANKEGHDGSDVDGLIHKGTVYLVKENIARHKDPEAMAEKVLLHEYTHGDIKNMFGNDIAKELNKLFKSVGGYKGLKAIADKHNIDLREYVKAGRRAGRLPEARQAMLMDELLAFIGQEKPTLKTKVKEIAGMIRQWLRDKGLFKLAEYGETDLLNVIREARESAKGVSDGGTRFIRGKVDSNTTPAKPDSVQSDMAFSKNTDFGKRHIQFKHDAKGAIKQLIQDKDGEAVAALHHKEVGDIDLVWGKEGTGKSDGFGLAKLVKYHPEVLDDLQGVLDGMDVVSRTGNRVSLESENHEAGISLNWFGKDKTWLLTAYMKEEKIGGTHSIDTNPIAKEGDYPQNQSSNTQSIDLENGEVKFSRSSAKGEEAELKADYKEIKESWKGYMDGKGNAFAKVASATIINDIGG